MKSKIIIAFSILFLALVSIIIFLAAGDYDFFSRNSSNIDIRPNGYIRIEIPHDSLIELNSKSLNLPFSFAHSSEGNWIDKSELGWGDIFYPFCNGRIQITYKKIQNNLSTLINDAHNMTFKHSIVADGINLSLYIDSDRNINGILFSLRGNAASRVQFFATDSLNHFLRGSAYVYAQPNPDSLKPIDAFLEGEILNIMNSLKWVVAK